MLPDFPIPLRDLDGVVIARDIPACAFFHGFPDNLPLTPCWEQEGAEGRARLEVAVEQWFDAIVLRAIVRPRLSLELVRRLGEDRNRILVAYLRAVNWLDPARLEADLRQYFGADRAEALLAYLDQIGDEAASDEAPVLHVDPGEGPRPAFARRALVDIPGPNVRRLLRTLAERARVPTHVAWATWTVSEFIFNWRTTLEDELRARADQGRAGLALNDPDTPDEIPVDALA